MIRFILLGRPPAKRTAGYDKFFLQTICFILLDRPLAKRTAPFSYFLDLELRRYNYFTWRALLLSRMRTSRGLESSSDWTDGNSRVFKMFKSFFTPS